MVADQVLPLGAVGRDEQTRRGSLIVQHYLRLGVPVRPAECLLVFGGHDLGVAGRAAELYAGGIAPFIVVSGGAGWQRFRHRG
jgi:hypothetical protein